MMNDNKRAKFNEAVARYLQPDSYIFDDINQAVGDDRIDSFYVRPETLFDSDSVYERIVAFVLTERRFVLIYSDTNYEMMSSGELVTTTQSIDLSRIVEHHVIRRRELEGENAGRLNSVTLRLRWGSGFTQDLQPGGCDDPNCTNDHGYIGVITNEDCQIFLDALQDAEYFEAGRQFIDDVVKRLNRGA